MATEKDWSSYLTAVVDLSPPDGAPFRVSPAPSGETGQWPCGPTPLIHVITAWNPDSVLLSAEVNQARHDQLVADLDHQRLDWWPAIGRDPDGRHFEEGVAVMGLTDAAAVTVGLAYGQAAVFAWSPPQWQVLSCTDERRHTCGWRTGPVPPG